MIIDKFLSEIRLNESSADFIKIEQGIVDMFKHNNSRAIVNKLFNNYKDFVEMVKGNDNVEPLPDKKEVKKQEVKKQEVKKKTDDVPPETAMGKMLGFVKDLGDKEDKKPEVKKQEVKKKKPEASNLEAAVAVLLNRVTGEKIELDLDRYYSTAGRKKSDILSDPKLLKTIGNIKAASITDEKRLLMPLFQVNIKLDEYLSGKKHEMTISEKQRVVLAVFWILLIEGKYVPDEDKINVLARKYGQYKNIKGAFAKNKRDKEVAAKKETIVEESTINVNNVKLRRR
jgi:hypothetical protein